MKDMEKLALLLALPVLCQSYVFDLNHSVTVESSNAGEKMSCFGYALDFAKDNRGQPWLMVGAPKANIGGAIFACKLDNLSGSRLQCRESQANFQTATNAIFDDQLLGVTVVTAAPSNSQSSQVKWYL